MSYHRLFESLAPLSWETDISPHLANRTDSSSSSSAAAAASSSSPSSVALDNILATTLTNARLLIDSIPAPTPQFRPAEAATSPTVRARACTDSKVAAPLPALDDASPPTKKEGKGTVVGRGAGETEAVEKLRREWKDLKVHQQTQGGGGGGNNSSSNSNSNNNNPHQIAVYKMSAKDGKGAWFARRSLHRAGIGGGGGDDGPGGFEKW
ncbi:hypothetical protein VTH06DRAFT_3459 [Thermothelomyces fergusii]